MMTSRYLIVDTGLSMDTADDLAEDYPFRQTQALLMVIGEADAWINCACQHIGQTPPACLASVVQWLARAEDFLGDITEEIEDGNEDVSLGRLSADDDLYDLLDEIITGKPEWDCWDEDDDSLPDEATYNTLISLVEFWIDNVETHLIRVQQHFIGDGEVLGILSRQQCLTKVRA
ncbi:hypothetical protein [Propionivibrio limicola]|uniref:hypothetical protein n=1 Tax=Propionivibrio limicola TaxID=167645 RepID=UPI001290D2D4|nr:hypothetical protein [Propionivibrio limicola]